MMLKIALTAVFSTFLVASSLYFDEKPKSITKKDLETIRDFEELAYSIAEEREYLHVNISRVASFIWDNRLHVNDYTRLKVDAVGNFGYRTPRGETDNQMIINEDNYNYYRAGLQANYNLYDGKTSKDIQNKKLEYKSKILSLIEKYASQKAELHKFKKSLKFKRLIQIRSKVRVETAQIYLDERVKVIAEIMELNNKIKESTITCKYLSLELQNLIVLNKRDDLEAML